MKIEGMAAAALGAVLLAGAAVAAPAPAIRACDVDLNVADPDPAGLNVRASPGGAIIGALKPKHRWVQLHVTGQSGPWAAIDSATLITEDHAEGRPMSPSHGFVAFSKLEINELKQQAFIYETPSEDSKVLLAISEADEANLPHAEVLGCDGLFLKVKVNGIVGWTANYCSNEFTTCV
jgi:hypothetical protein